MGLSTYHLPKLMIYSENKNQSYAWFLNSATLSSKLCSKRQKNQVATHPRHHSIVPAAGSEFAVDVAWCDLHRKFILLETFFLPQQRQPVGPPPAPPSRVIDIEAKRKHFG